MFRQLFLDKRQSIYYTLLAFAKKDKPIKKHDIALAVLNIKYSNVKQECLCVYACEAGNASMC